MGVFQHTLFPQANRFDLLCYRSPVPSKICLCNLSGSSFYHIRTARLRSLIHFCSFVNLSDSRCRQHTNANGIANSISSSCTPHCSCFLACSEGAKLCRWRQYLPASKDCITKSRFRDVLSKLRLWQLTQYGKDADTILLAPLDPIFTDPEISRPMSTLQITSHYSRDPFRQHTYFLPALTPGVTERSSYNLATKNIFALVLCWSRRPKTYSDTTS